MEKVIDVNIAGTVFPIEEDACYLLKNYLERFELTLTGRHESREVMEDVEARVTEIFQKEKKFSGQAIDVSMVRTVIECLGEIKDDPLNASFTSSRQMYEKGEKILFRDPDAKKIAGVCSGLSAYFNVDVTFVRIAFLCSVICWGAGFWLYIALWVATPKAQTLVDRLKMRGFATTLENVKRFSTEYKQ